MTEAPPPPRRGPHKHSASQSQTSGLQRTCLSSGGAFLLVYRRRTQLSVFASFRKPTPSHTWGPPLHRWGQLGVRRPSSGSSPRRWKAGTAPQDLSPPNLARCPGPEQLLAKPMGEEQAEG